MLLFLKRFGLTFSLAAISYLAMLIYPNWAFAYSYEYENVTVYSDRPIESVIEVRLEDALTNLEHSELYHPNMHFNIFICYDEYRLGFFTRNPNVGGVVNGVISENVFLREADIAANKIIPPGTWLMDAANRSLTYYLSHEMTHAMQARHKRFVRLTHPAYIIEGYADYIAKKDTFNYENALAEYLSGHEFYAAESPLYNMQHLAIAHLIEKESLTFKEILATKPDLNSVLQKLE